jgi:hypothetical protein
MLYGVIPRWVGNGYLSPVTEASMKPFLRSLALAMLLVPGPASAQVSMYGDTVVEFLGLRTWTPQALEAAVRRVAPGTSLASHGCAVVLRDSLGFADAAVLSYSGMGSDTVWVSIRVVEPGDTGLVRYNEEQRTPQSVPGRWASLLEAVTNDRGAVSYFQHPEVLLDGADSIYGRAVPSAARVARSQVKALTAEDDFVDAVRLLRFSADPNARELAAYVISNFLHRDEAWHALADGMLGGSDHAASAAAMVFAGSARTDRYTVDWAPALDALVALVGGTNLFAYDGVLSSLVATGIQPGLARRLTRANPDLLASHAVARNRIVRQPARRFLLHAGSEDHGANRTAWLEWIRS